MFIFKVSAVYWIHLLKWSKLWQLGQFNNTVVSPPRGSLWTTGDKCYRM